MDNEQLAMNSRQCDTVISSGVEKSILPIRNQISEIGTQRLGSVELDFKT
jgi:hypothetical protein